MKPSHLSLAAALIIGLVTGHAQAQTFDLRSYFETLTFSSPQTAGSLWTFHSGDQNGTLLPPIVNHYGYGPYTYTQIGPPINAGDTSWIWNPGHTELTPTFNGLFVQPGPSAAESTAIVFNAQADTWLDGVTVLAELIGNGLAGNGLDITVRHTRGSVSTALGGFLVTGSNAFNQSFSFGSTPILFAAGDRIEVDVGPNGNYTSDHLNINVSISAPVPEPEIYAMMGMGLGLMGWVARRRKQQNA